MIDPLLLTFSQAAERLNVPESWLRRSVAAKVFEVTRPGRHVRFSEKNLADIIAACQQPAVVSPIRRRRTA